MCGLAGVWSPTMLGVEDLKLAEMMTRSLAHRGPDGEGFYNNANIALGHRRLAIIDVIGGQQPMSNEDGNICVVFNGELYNHKQLRRGLEDRNHVFKTHCDTEVLVHLYEEHGPGLCRYLNGMFSFALWDSKARTLLLARDRLGIKPLFYVWKSGKLYFASESKAITSALPSMKRVKRSALIEYIQYRHIAGDETIYEDVRSLSPASYTLISRSGVSTHKYWALPSEATDGDNSKEADKHVEVLLRSSVAARMISDVPWGTLLSGGMDSSIITANAAELHGPGLPSYCIGYNDREWDERSYARLVAQRYHTDHREYVIEDTSMLSSVPHIIRHMGRPLSHPSMLPLWFLSPSAKKDVSMVLSGDGSDEVFAGYKRYNAFVLGSLINKFAGGSTALRLASRVLSTIRRDRRPCGILVGVEAERIVRNCAFNDTSLLNEFACHQLLLDVEQKRLTVLENHAGRNSGPADLLLRHELDVYLPISLERLDHMTMSAGLEARVPFLDHRIIEYVFSIPVQSRMMWYQRKPLVRKIAGRLLPWENVKRPKCGFGVPVYETIRSNQNGMERIEHLLEQTLVRAEIVKKQSVSHLKSLLADRNGDELLWPLYNLAIWNEEEEPCIV